MGDPAIQVKGLQKSFKETHVLNGVEFKVGKDIWFALAWCLGILVVAYLFAMRACRRRAA